MSYRAEIATPAEQVQTARHFNSGVNSAGDVRGFFLSGRWVGITCDEVRGGLLEELEAFSGGPSCLFVDSGAFGEMDFVPFPVLNAAREITPAKWERIFEVYARAATAYRGRCYVVAPDRIGDQAHTLELLARYAPNVAAVASIGAQVIVPVQKGAIPMGEFFKRQQEILGLRVAPIAGVPMKKDATTIAELAAFVDSLPWFGARIHLLGLGPASKLFDRAIETIKTRRPNCSITTDSCTLARLSGRTNGPGGTRRILTAKQDEARELGLTESINVKQYGLQAQGLIERDLELEAANAAGWFDVELFDTLEEAVAFHAESKASRLAPVARAPEAA